MHVEIDQWSIESQNIKCMVIAKVLDHKSFTFETT